NQSTAQATSEIRNVVWETQLKLNKRTNVIAYGIPEQEEETDARYVKTSIDDLFHELGSDFRPIHVGRIGGKEDGKARPVRVTMKSVQEKYDVMKNKKSLASNVN